MKNKDKAYHQFKPKIKTIKLQIQVHILLKKPRIKKTESKQEMIKT